jgi:hypothetical protein
MATNLGAVPLAGEAWSGDDGWVTPARPLLLGALAGLALLTACGSADAPGAGTGGSTTPPRATTTSPSTSPSTSPLEDLPLPSGSTAGRGVLLTVQGTVTEGVEAGCLLFTTEPPAADGPWVLVGNTEDLEPGMTVTLRGSRRDDVMTTCQQGLPFQVEAVLER